MKLTKSFVIILVLFVFLSLFAACGDNKTTGTTGIDLDVLPTEEQIDYGELIILYTNDVHNAYQRNDNAGQMGYAALAAYRDELVFEGRNVIIIDGGDALQGDAIGTLSKGEYIIDLMNEVGYDIAVPGNHEFDYGIDIFLDLAFNQAEFTYISCNFINLSTGEPVFDAYQMVDINGIKVAFVGITTPETLMKSTSTFFQDEGGEYTYGFYQGNDGQDLYDCVQNAIDNAKAAGADYVIAVGHLGMNPESTPWTSTEVIANTSGLTAFLDAHSHSLIESEYISDQDDNPVLLCSTGEKLTALGEIHVDLNTGFATATLVTEIAEDNEDVQALADDIHDQLDDLLEEIVARSEVNLVITDPTTGERIVRSQETNLGDLCADAYRAVLGADIALVNGGEIRDDLVFGDVTYGDIIKIHPFHNMACMVEVSGQVILDALELGYSYVGDGEFAGFLQVSGLTCEIDTTIPSGVVLNEEGEFVEVQGERRVKNVMINGEPIDPQKTYTVASHNYMLKSGGDGFSMFIGSRVLKDDVCLDNEVLIRYVQDTLGGVISAIRYGNPDGEGRITIIAEDSQSS